WDFNVDTPWRRPLGGAHSAACYLAATLATRGNFVALVSATREPGNVRGVTCLSAHSFRPDQLHELDLDVAIVLLGAGAGLKVRSALAAKTALVLWTQHASDQSAVMRLSEPAVRGLYDGFALVSDWQREQFVSRFQL